MKKTKILIIGLNQLPHRFLSNICKYLSGSFDITIISPDEGQDKLTDSNYTSVWLNVGIPNSSFRLAKRWQTLIRILRINVAIKKYVYGKSYDIIYFWDQTWAFLTTLFLGGRRKYVMQMFAPGVHNNQWKNKRHDLQVKFNTLFFKHIFIGSDEVRRIFSLPRKKTFTIGVGADSIQYCDRVFNSIHLVYLGTLSNRYVHETVTGFVKFYLSNRSKIDMSYTIIGGGTTKAVNDLEESIKFIPAEVPVRYLGWLEETELLDVFNNCNIGVAYNRITPYYTNNISTKLYEYLLSGMPVIAVKNNSMLNAINDSNGVLIDDSPEGFAQGLEIMLDRLGTYDSRAIANTAAAYSVKKVVEDRMIPFFNSIIQE